MDVVNRTPFPVAPIPGRLLFPNYSLTLAVKGTFNLVPNGIAQVSDEQLNPTGDEYYPDQEDQEGSVRYESDFAYFKPMADLLLVGKCYPPSQKPARACRVTFQVGERKKSLAVFGDRHWKGFLKSMSNPKSFTSKELRYENAFGGGGFEKNPVGKGFEEAHKRSKRKRWLLPNIEHVDQLLRSHKSQPEPAGFGPLGRSWSQRSSKRGTYTKRYVKDRWPWFPEDMDLRYFNAAPPDLQVENYLKGNETLYFENLHPVHSHYHATLPGIRVRCFLNLNDLTNSENALPQLREVPMHLDTLWVDMDREQLILTWRGWVQVQSEDYSEVHHVFITSEPFDQERASLKRCEEVFLSSLSEEEEEWSSETEEDLEKVPEKGDDDTLPMEFVRAESSESINFSSKDWSSEIDRRLTILFSQAGLDLQSLPLEVRESLQTEKKKVLKELMTSDPTKMARKHQEKMEAQLSELLTRRGQASSPSPPLSEKAKSEQARLIQELGLGDANLVQSPQMASMLGMTSALLVQMGLDPENLDPLIQMAKKKRGEIPTLVGPKKNRVNGREIAPGSPDGSVDPSDQQSQWTRERVVEASQRKASLSNLDLSGLDLSGLDLKALDLSGSDLRRTDLSQSDLSGSILTLALLEEANLSQTILIESHLSRADLPRANLEQAQLEMADLTGASLKEARLVGASMNDAIFENANLAGAVADDIKAKGVNFSGARMDQASFRGALCTGADFSGARMAGTDFSNATLAEASMEGVHGPEVRFVKAQLSELRASEGSDFSRGVFHEAVAPDSMWVDAKLHGANFSYGNLEGADFSNAQMEKTNLSAANLRHARFIRSNLRGSLLILANLFEGSLEKADLCQADLRGANLYGAEFLDAAIDDTKFEGSNLKMTKLAGI